MPERWKTELRRLRTVEPSPDVWERAAQGPARPARRHRTGGAGRLLAAAVSLTVVAAAGVGAWRAFAPRANPVGPIAPTSSPTGFFLTQSEVFASLSGTSAITVTVVFDTNLPDGTIAEKRMETEQHGGGVGETSVNTAVHDGQLRITVDEPVCNNLGTGFDLTVKVRPIYDDWVVPGPIGPGGSQSPWPPTQPDSILQALGDHFQNLTGDQVTTAESSEGSINQIVVQGSYDWPQTPSGFEPPPCPSPVPSP